MRAGSPPSPSSPSLAARLAQREQRPLLRVLTCGSVDDGKSTLIGRLLHDAQALYDDQLAALRTDSARHGTTGPDHLDFALLVDGLAAEREQGITIDVAYRYFSTPRRRFILADTPGHPQYTRNMATAASTADVAVLLVDARLGLLAQTHRHAVLLSLMGLRHAVVAVNKMDLVGWDEAVFRRIADDARAFAARLDLPDLTCLPLSALTGANVTRPADEAPWHAGPSLLDHLETLAPLTDPVLGPFRFPVQGVSRPDAGFRGQTGLIVGGMVSVGDPLAVWPSGQTSRLARIVTADGDLESARAGQSVTLVLQDPVDVARGDVLTLARAPCPVSDQVSAHVVWMDPAPLLPGRPYLARIGTAETGAKVTALKHRLDVSTLTPLAARTLDMNEVGVCTLSFDRAVAFDPYRENRDMGGFILIDRLSNATVGCGMIDFPLRRAANIHWQPTRIDRTARAAAKGQKPAVLWFTGLSGSGKSTLADRVEQRLHGLGHHTMLLDGDNVRHGLNRDLGFTDADRVENIRRVAEVARLMTEAGLITLVSFISPFRAERQMARDLMDEGLFVEIFVDAPLAVCEARDPKGLYAKARAGLIPNFTGLGSPYEPPEAPDLRVATDQQDPDVLADEVIALLRARAMI
ncbi:adenylyl-sulfate kinase [Pararhodospirillum photometricum]|uniref:Multifunctional fusion protein n=1 Tax=Pararhodospirillum photometricum DSM 122 TaxID=1150469 RepID=H6SQR4_PARPM|nr:adenylyl-sulfate kinase [Pararhodospirillum photometricum]CCG07379.1 Sulfate adenylyltransferase subunit 1 / adenylylsulfate kinase [Pararhodospirillum photometricum DSM 122]